MVVTDDDKIAAVHKPGEKLMFPSKVFTDSHAIHVKNKIAMACQTFLHGIIVVFSKDTHFSPQRRISLTRRQATRVLQKGSKKGKGSQRSHTHSLCKYR